MKEKIGKAIGYGGLISAGLGIGVEEADAQDTRNFIRSRNPEYSATGEGVLLKDFVYDVNDSTFNLEERFGLYADVGDVSYEVIDTRRGLQNVLTYLRADSSAMTPEKRASISYIEGFLQGTTQQDAASANALRNAIANGVIDSEEMAGIAPDRMYMLIARSSNAQGKTAQSVPILFRLRYRRPREPEEVPEERQDTVAVRDTTYVPLVFKKPSDVRFTAGVEGGVGSNKEAVFGTFLGMRHPNVSVEIFGNYPVREGDPIFSDPVTEEVMRESQLITGPAGESNTYKTRTDVTETTIESVARGEGGVEVAPGFWRISFPLRAGISFEDEREIVDGTSTIAFERDGDPLGEPEVIENTKIFGPKLERKYFAGAGLRFNITDNLAIGVSGRRTFDKRTGNRNSVRGGVRIRY